MGSIIDKIKYPRTFHLPYSLTLSADDKRLPDESQFIGKEVSCSIKMDGENTTVYPDGSYHARSVNGFGHKWQNWLERYISGWASDIPNGWRVCGENLYAEHSIKYCFTDETYFFQCFGIYNEKNECLPIDEELEFCELLGIRHVPVFYRGIYNKDLILNAFNAWKANEKSMNGNESEGFVVRFSDSFSYNDFSKSTGKFVRANHVHTNSRWNENWKPNALRSM